MRFDRAIADTFLVAVRAGATNDVAAAHAGVDLAVVRKWLRGGTPKTYEFRKAVDKARADLELLAVGTLRRSMSEDGSAAMYIAELARGESEFERLRALTT